MFRIISWSVVALLLTGGCNYQSAENRSNMVTATMTNCVTGAAYLTPPFGNDRRRARIMGQAMKIGGSTADVQSRAQDAAGQESPGGPRPAQAVGMATGLQYEATLNHMAAWDKTFVRIRCNDGSWSNWQLVSK